MSRFVLPSATSAAISRSRSVSASGPPRGAPGSPSRVTRRPSRVRCPLLIQVVERDSVISTTAASEAAAAAPRGTLKRYSGLRHFDVYHGEGFDRLVSDQVEFLRGSLR